MDNKSNIFLLLAITSVVASTFVSCRGGLREAEHLDLEHTPVQIVNDMFAVQTKNGHVEMRIEALVMEHYEARDSSYDSFPAGISVYGYTPDGLLESVIVSDNAKHITPKRKSSNDADEIWEAFGNVIIHNVLKQETMETDTVYWDRDKSEIYTDCYVKLYSPQGFMQGYGMRSDDHMQNAILYNPFNSFGITVRDSTAVVIDSVNFIGPFPKND